MLHRTQGAKNARLVSAMCTRTYIRSSTYLSACRSKHKRSQAMCHPDPRQDMKSGTRNNENDEIQKKNVHGAQVKYVQAEDQKLETNFAYSCPCIYTITLYLKSLLHFFSVTHNGFSSTTKEESYLHSYLKATICKCFIQCWRVLKVTDSGLPLYVTYNRKHHWGQIIQSCRSYWIRAESIAGWIW